MDKKTVFLLILAAALILIGCILFAGAMTLLKWDFTKLSTNKFETNRHGISEPFHSISILSDTADVVFLPSKLDKTAVVCYEQNNVKHSVSVKDGTLVVEVVDERKWYDHIGIFSGTPKITLEIPGGTYGTLDLTSDTGDVEIPDSFQFESITVCQSTGDVTCRASATGAIRIKTSTGNILVENIAAASLDLSVSTGKVTVGGVTCTGDLSLKVSTGKASLADSTCQNLASTGSTGDLTLKNVTAAGSFSIQRTTGDVHINQCDAAQISVQTDTGDVTGSFLTDKVIFAQTDTGRVSIPKTTTGDPCHITTTTGNIQITVNQ